MRHAWIAVLGLALATGVLADDTNTEAEVKKDHGISISFDSEHGSSKSKVYEKLTPDQIFELEKIKAAQQSDSIPSLAPLIVGIVFACPVAIVVVILAYRQRRNLVLHKTLAAMIDKGVPIPPELLQPVGRPRKSDLQRGLVLIGVGLGLTIFFAAEHESAWGLGCIPLFMGVGYLVAWKLANKNGNG